MTTRTVAANDTANETTLATLISGLRAHLQDCPMPEPVMVTLNLPVRQISIQPGRGRDAVDKLGELLLWAQTLDQLTARWWHTPSGTLHVSTEGRSATGIEFLVYTGIPFGDCAALVPLEPDASEDVSLDEVHTLYMLLQEHQAHVTEVNA